jgi:hypothetical protein
VGANGAGNVGHVPPSTTTSSVGNGNPRAPAPPSKPANQSDGSAQTTDASANSNHGAAEKAAKKADGAGADDTLLLAVLVLGFTVAVSGVVIAAGRRGGRRVH